MAILSDKQFLGVAVVAAAGAWYLYSKREAVVQAVNPLNHDNIFNTAANNITEAITGRKGDTIGTLIYDWLHPNEEAELKALLE